MFTTIDRHFTWRIVRMYTFLVGALIVFFVLLHYLEYVDDFMDRSAPMDEIYRVYYPSYIPEIVRLISPLALFLAATVVTGRMAQSHQIIAMNTGGLPMGRLLIPFLVIGTTIALCALVVGGWIAPRTNQTVLAYDALYLKNAPRQVQVSDIHRQNDPTSVLTVGYYDRRTDTAHRVQLQTFGQNGTLLRRIDGQQMVWRDSVWHFALATVRTFEGTTERLTVAAPLDTLLNVLPRDLARTERDIETMTIPVARAYVEALKRSGVADTGRAEVGYISKIAYPFANLIVMMLALPLACRRRAGGQAGQIAVALLVAFAYLAAQKLVEPFGFSGELNAQVAVVMPHLAFTACALALLARART